MMMMMMMMMMVQVITRLDVASESSGVGSCAASEGSNSPPLVQQTPGQSLLLNYYLFFSRTELQPPRCTGVARAGWRRTMTSSPGCWWAPARARAATWRRPRRENSGDWLLVTG